MIQRRTVSQEAALIRLSRYGQWKAEMRTVSLLNPPESIGSLRGIGQQQGHWTSICKARKPLLG